MAWNCKWLDPVDWGCSRGRCIYRSASGICAAMDDTADGVVQALRDNVKWKQGIINELIDENEELLDVCRMMLKIMEAEELDEKYDGEATILRDVIERRGDADC